MRGDTQVKVQIRSWAEESGLWKEFVGVRERLKKDGVPPARAWLEAAKELDPEKWAHLGGGPMKLDLPHVRSVDDPVDLPHVRSEEVVDAVVAGCGGNGRESATKAVFAGKKVATVKVVEWVASNMQVEDVSPSDAPSSEAWGMLVWARRSPVNESQFWGTIYAKLLPSRSAIEAEQRYSDDGVKIEETAKMLLGLSESISKE